MKYHYRISIGLFSLCVLLASCQTAQLSTAVQEEIPADADPAKVEQARDLIREGNLAIAQRDFDGALDRANESIRIQPLFDGYYLKGLALSRNGESRSALAAFEKAEAIRPTSEQLLLTSGMLYESTGNSEKAQEKFLKLTEAYPEDPVYWYRAGVGFKKLGQLDKAYEYLTKSVATDFEHKDQAYLQLGDVCLEQKRYEESEKYFALARQANPELEEASSGANATRAARWMDQGNAALDAGKVDEAIQAFQKAVQLTPSSGAPYFFLGRAYLEKGDVSEALARTSKGIELDPDSVSGRIVHSTALRENGQTLQARKSLEEGIRLSPGEVELINQLGLSCKDSGDLKCALIQFENALKIKPGYYPARLNAFYTYIDSRRYEEAERHLRGLEDLAMPAEEKEKARRYYKLSRFLGTGDRFFEQNQFYRAVLEYRKALNVDGTSTAVLNSLGRVEFVRNRLAVAANYYNQTLKQDADNVQALEGLLRVYTRAGNVGARRGVERRLDRLSQTNPEAAVAFGRIYEEDQDWNKAAAHYQKLLKRYPEHELVRRRMAHVYYRQALDLNRQNNPDGALRLLARSQQLDSDLPGLENALSIVRDNKKNARYLPELEMAEYVYQSGRFAEAERRYRALHRKWPRPAFLVRVADSLIQQGKQDEGFRILERAARENPASIDVREAMYANYIRAGRTAEARGGFRRIIEANEDAYYSHYKLGIIQLMDNEIQQAFESFQTALIYRPDFIPARLARGVALYEQGKEQESETDFQEALQYDTFGKELASLNLALIDLNANETAKARRSLEEITRLFPRFSDPHYHLSYMDFESGNYRGALNRINRAIELEKTSEYYLARAQILEKIPGQRVALQNTYRDLLQDFPGLSEKDRNEVRSKLGKLSSDSARTLSPLSMPAVDPRAVYRHRDLIIYQEQNRIVAARMGAESPEYVREFDSPIVDSRDGYWIYVALRNRVVSLDPQNGQIVDEWEIADVCRLLGAAGDMAVVSGKDCGPGKESQLKHLADTAEDRILGPRDFTASRAGVFYYADGFYHISSLGQKSQIAKAWSGVEAAAVNVASVRGLESQGENLILAHSGGYLVLEKDGLEVKESVNMPVQWIGHKEDAVYVFDGKALHRIADGIIQQTVRMPAPVRDNAIHIIGEGQVLYVGTDSILRLVDSSGKVLWQENPGKFDSRLLSVYY